jgi:hypothetical protein
MMHAYSQEIPSMNRFHEIVAIVETVALRLGALILMLAALFQFIRYALH